MKKEINCPGCDVFFTLTYKTKDPVKSCPFCCENIEEDEVNDFEDDEDN